MTPSVWKIAVTEKDYISYFQLLCFNIYHFLKKKKTSDMEMQAYTVEDRGNDVSKKLTEVYLMVDSL